MEQVTNLIDKNALMKPVSLTNANPKYDYASNEERQNYHDRLYLIVLDSFRLSSQSPTDEEVAVRAQSWTRLLMGIVPPNDLQAVFDRAFQDHTTNFPVSAYDLKDAHTRLVEEERLRIYKQKQLASIAEAASQSSANYYFECKSCYNGGFRYVDDPKGLGGRGVVRCDKCNYWFHRDANRKENIKL